ncbi:MAG TPA: GNAT family N-acetyltransferase [Chitinophagaceae bacterium]|nr:GNAT family N-acetyltransferase [Chitinophagaceae bacterium]
MEIEIIKTNLEEIKAFRVLFLQENNFQFVCDKCHYYGWADTYLFTVNGEKAGYGSVWGTNKREDRDAIFEFYLLKPFRKMADLVFPQFHNQSGAVYIESQSNDPLLSSMLYQFSQNINAEAILFKDSFDTDLQIPGATFGRKTIRESSGADEGDFIVLQNGETVAEGGLMLNYNMPFADIYMNVKENFRQQGLGSFIVQELKKEAYRMGRVPAARCNVNNHISKATLLKAGFEICGHRLLGNIKK